MWSDPTLNLTVSVVVPYRAGDCPHRAAAWSYVAAWWARRHPTWPVIAAADTDATHTPWRKGVAVARAVAHVDTPITVVADADVICPGVVSAVTAVRDGAPWAVPHRAVYRLTAVATAVMLAGGAPPSVGEPAPGRPGSPYCEVHRAQVGGGVVVLPTETLRAVPIDSRFAGWGQEDIAWSTALRTLAGVPALLSGPLWHLWHPPAERQSRRVGSRAGRDLYSRYRAAAADPAAMRALVTAGRINT